VSDVNPDDLTRRMIDEGALILAEQGPAGLSLRKQNQAIRDWARTKGMKVSDRGRIPSDVLTAYHKAS
jgi:hypothetical protein